MEHKLTYLLLSFVDLPKVMISLKEGQKKKKKTYKGCVSAVVYYLPGNCFFS